MSVQEEKRRLMDENLRLREELETRFRPGNIIGNNLRGVHLTRAEENKVQGNRIEGVAGGRARRGNKPRCMPTVNASVENDRSVSCGNGENW